jgi:hypothetical protein
MSIGLLLKYVYSHHPNLWACLSCRWFFFDISSTTSFYLLSFERENTIQLAGTVQADRGTNILYLCIMRVLCFWLCDTLSAHPWQHLSINECEWWSWSGAVVYAHINFID